MTDQPLTEDKVRQMLQRRAGDVTPSPDAWSQIEARLNTDGDGESEGEGRVIPLSTRSSRRLSPLLVAAALVVALGVAALVVARPDGTNRVRTGPAAPSSSTPTTMPAPPPAPAGVDEPPALWPATTAAGLAALQREADTVGRPDLVDPRAAAGQYLSDRFLAVATKRVAFEVGEYRPGDNQSGEVPYVADGLPGTVSVRRSAGEGSIWYVVENTHLRLPLNVVANDDRPNQVVIEVRPTVAGRLDTAVSNPQGRKGPSGSEDVAAGRVVGIAIDEQLVAARQAIVLLTFTAGDGVVSLAEVRLEIPTRSSTGPISTNPGYCAEVLNVMGERPASYVGSAEHLEDISRLQGAAPPEILQDLKLYYAHVRSEVDPAVPASQETENWPPDVRAALQRIDVHDARLCREAP